MSFSVLSLQATVSNPQKHLPCVFFLRVHTLGQLPSQIFYSVKGNERKLMCKYQRVVALLYVHNTGQCRYAPTRCRSHGVRGLNILWPVVGLGWVVLFWMREKTRM